MSKFFSSLLLFQILWSSGLASDTVLPHHTVVFDLVQSWEIYDEQSKSIVPYLKRSKSTYIQFDLNLNKYRPFDLYLDLPANHYLWVDHELVFVTTHAKKWTIPIDSLTQVYSDGKIRISLYNDELNSDQIQTLIVSKTKFEKRQLANESLFRNENPQENLFILVTIFALGLIVVFRSFYFRLFQEYFSISRAAQLRQNFDLITAHSPVGWPNLGFLLLYGALIGAAYLNFDMFQVSQVDFSFTATEQSPLWEWGNVAIVTFGLMVLKYILISIMVELFNLQKIKSNHFFTYFRQSLIIVLLGFCFSILNGVFDGRVINEYQYSIQFLVVVIWIARGAFMFFVLNKIYTFRKLHLFSYLCSTELIPLILFFKFFLK